MSNSKKITLRDYFLAYLTPTLWATFIFILSAQQVLPGFSISVYDFIFKKTAHMFVYAVLYFLLFRAYAQTSHHHFNYKNYIIPLSIALLYAVIDEMHQSTVPGRYPTLRDVGYDLLGMTTVLLYQLKLI